MKKHIVFGGGILFIFALGFVAGKLNGATVNAQSKPVAVKPAYMVVSALIKNPDQMKPYGDKALPLAKAAGMEILGSGESGTTVQLLEGQWPYQGTVLVERYTSMDALLKFWNSTGYREAKKLREGLADVNFIIAVEGVE